MRRYTSICLYFFASLVAGQTCPFGLSYNNANLVLPLQGNSMVAFGREGDLPYFTSTLSIVPPYTSSLPQVNGNQILEGCFAANPPLVAPPASYQRGAGAQRDAVIHSSDNTQIGFALVHFLSPKTLTIWALNPDLTISNPLPYELGSELNAVLTADFNGDGKPDLAAIGQADATSSAVWILINNGALTFKNPVPYAVPDIAVSAAAGDFDSDGRLDLAVITRTLLGTGGKVAILYGNADGTFRTGPVYPAGQNPQGIAAVDLDGDGITDLVIADEAGNAVNELLGNHDGTFRAFTTLISSASPALVAAGDFNNDGVADLAFGSSRTGLISVALGTGGGRFGTPRGYNGLYQQSSVIVTDVNQDGHVDLVIGSGTPEAIGADVKADSIGVLVNNGDGTFQGAPLYPLVSSPMQTVVADFDGDGKLDVAGADSQGTTVAVQFGQGAGIFGQPVTFSANIAAGHISSMATADFDGDGKPDLILGSTAGRAATVALYKNGRTFQTSTLTLSNFVQAVATGDFDGDGHPDAVVAFGTPQSPANTPAGIAVLPGDGHGGFKTPVTFSGITGAYMAAGDLNNDGKLDLAVAIAPASSSNGLTRPGLTFLLGQGNGSFTQGQTIFDSYAVWSVTLADLNGDGNLDVVSTIVDANVKISLGVALGKGDGTFQTPIIAIAGVLPNPVAVTDLDGDGIPDLVTGISGGFSSMGYFQGNGDGTFKSARPIDGGPLPYDVHAADLNGDGKPDLLIGNQVLGGGLTALISIPPAAGVLTSVSGASFLPAPLPPESIASAFGTGLATDSVIDTDLPLRTDINGTSITVTDSKGASRKAPLFFVSNLQINFEVPPGTALGIANVTATSPSGQASGQVEIGKVSPAFFMANAQLGLPVASTDRVGTDLSQTYGVVVKLDSGNNLVASPIDLGSPSDSVYLTLYATGVRNASSLAGVSATIGGLPAQVQYAGPQNFFVGLDQVNLLIPHVLAGKGKVDVLLTVDGVDAPPAVIVIQ